MIAALTYYLSCYTAIQLEHNHITFVETTGQLLIGCVISSERPLQEVIASHRGRSELIMQPIRSRPVVEIQRLSEQK